MAFMTQQPGAACVVSVPSRLPIEWGQRGSLSLTPEALRVELQFLHQVSPGPGAQAALSCTVSLRGLPAPAQRFEEAPMVAPAGRAERPRERAAEALRHQQVRRNNRSRSKNGEDVVQLIQAPALGQPAGLAPGRVQTNNVAWLVLKPATKWPSAACRRCRL